MSDRVKEIVKFHEVSKVWMSDRVEEIVKFHEISKVWNSGRFEEVVKCIVFIGHPCNTHTEVYREQTQASETVEY